MFVSLQAIVTAQHTFGGTHFWRRWPFSVTWLGQNQFIRRTSQIEDRHRFVVTGDSCQARFTQLDARLLAIALLATHGLVERDQLALSLLFGDGDVLLQILEGDVFCDAGGMFLVKQWQNFLQFAGRDINCWLNRGPRQRVFVARFAETVGVGHCGQLDVGSHTAQLSGAAVDAEELRYSHFQLTVVHLVVRREAVKAENSLHRSFAEALFTYDDASAVILDRSSENLRCRGRVSVDEHT